MLTIRTADEDTLVMGAEPETPSVPSVEDRYRRGTLQYTRAGLITLFVWLLWGDFCFTLMEAVVPNILPLKLNSLGASNLLIGLLMSTIPSAMGLTVNPIVSYKSDRYRSRWGRRIPFLLFSTPILALFLILIGFSEEIGHFVHGFLLRKNISISQINITLTLIGTFVVGFQFFNRIVMSMYYYLFNDVVPSAFTSRFFSLFRLVGAAAGSLFYILLFPYARTHMREIFLGAGVLYFVTFMLICWRVREENHPPLPQNTGERTGIVAAAKTYFVECFTHRFYLYYFLSNAMWGMAGCIGIFVIFLQLSLGLDMKQIAWLYGFINILTFLLYYPAGIISDRYHPLRLLLVSMAGITVIGLVGFIYLFHNFTPTAVLNITYVQVVIGLVIGIVYGTTNVPTAMKLLPKDRYGQFSSADGMVGSMAILVGGLLAGGFMDLMKMVHHGNPFYYRYIPVWTFVFQLASLILMFRVYRGWQRLGGDKNYVPPDVSVNIHK